MKTWIETDITGAGTGENPRRPDLGGYEDDPEVASSMLDKGTGTCLCRVAGPQAKVQAIVNAKGEQTDDQADSTIKGINPNAGLHNVDVADPEVDSLAEAAGLDPHHERVKNGKYGRPLWEQEPQIIESVAKAVGASISDKELDDIRHGRCDAHESALSKLRGQSGRRGHGGHGHT